MPGIAAVLVGTLTGILLAGSVAAMLVGVLPDSLRGPGTLWGVTAGAVALCIWLTTRLGRARRRR